jgi:hypothetical protein
MATVSGPERGRITGASLTAASFEVGGTFSSARRSG